MINTKVINWDINLSKHFIDMINNLPADKEVEKLSDTQIYLANNDIDEREDALNDLQRDFFNSQK